MAVVNSVAKNTGVHVSFKIISIVLSRYMPRSGTAGSYGTDVVFLCFVNIVNGSPDFACPTFKVLTAVWAHY